MSQCFIDKRALDRLAYRAGSGVSSECDFTARLAYGGPPQSLEAGLAPQILPLTAMSNFPNEEPLDVPLPVAKASTVAPSVRLATAIEGGGAQSPDAFERHFPPNVPEDTKPGLLVSYVYLKPFLTHRHRYAYRDWVLDSGAFSAHNSGAAIELQEYIDVCKQLMESDQTLSEIFALDVIGDWQASLKNCEEMWRQGVPAIPCYHRGEPEHVLKTIASTYPKIALGGVAMLRGDAKMNWAQNCFAHIWPCKVHGFGFGGEKQVMGLPWHSVDATNWEIGPCKFGRWNSYGQLSVRGSKQNLRAEVEWYLKLERQARGRWRREMAKLATLGPKPAELELSVRLATAGTNQERAEAALSENFSGETHVAI